MAIRPGRPRTGARGRNGRHVLHVSVPADTYDQVHALRHAVRAWTDTIVSPADVVRAAVADYLKRHRAWIDRAPPQQEQAAD